MVEKGESKDFGELDVVGILSAFGLKIGDTGTFESEASNPTVWKVVNLIESTPGVFEVIFQYKDRPVFKTLPISEIYDFKKFRPKIAEVNKVAARVSRELNLALQPEVVQQVLRFGFSPDNLLHTDELGNEFYFATPQLSNEGNLISFIFSYSPSEEIFYPIFAHRSKSNGGWRFSPGSEAGGFYSKGMDVIKNFSYVASTRPAPEIDDMLNSQFRFADKTFDTSLQNDFKDLLFKFYSNNVLQNPSKKGVVKQFEPDTYMLRFTEYTSSVCACPKVPYHILKPGNIAFEFFRETTLMAEVLAKGFGEMPKSIEEAIALQVADFDKDFVPDFEQDPIEIGNSYHSIFGAFRFEKFESTLFGRKTIWTMAFDLKGRIWIDSIVFADSKISKIGIQQETINASLYNLKPVEYTKYLGPKLQKTLVRISSDYTDITPIIELIPAVAQFRETRRITRMP
jgi:hypothetical protein